MALTVLNSVIEAFPARLAGAKQVGCPDTCCGFYANMLICPHAAMSLCCLGKHLQKVNGLSGCLRLYSPYRVS